jgi:chromosome segregation ATPase
MAALAATNSATSSATQALQSSLVRSRLELARREAEQAQANVRDLQTQVNTAETESEKRQDQVRSLSTQAQQADPTYSSALRSETTAGATQTKKQVSSKLPTTDFAATPSVVNGQGQTTGRIVNLAA